MKSIRSLLRNSLVGAGVLFAASVAFSGTSHAVLFDLTADFCTGGCGTPPFGTVDVTQVGANVHIVVDLANGPPNTVGWAQTGALASLFAFNATGVVVGDISVVQTFAGETLAALGGSFGSGGPGDFVFAIGCATCGNGNLGITGNLDFTIANATIADVTAENNLGFLFVADVFSSQTGNTGRVATRTRPDRGCGTAGFGVGLRRAYGVVATPGSASHGLITIGRPPQVPIQYLLWPTGSFPGGCRLAAPDPSAG